MPKRKTKLPKNAITVSIVLGLAASIPINIATNWLQEDILSQPFYVILLVAVSAVVTYFVLKLNYQYLTFAFGFMVIYIFLNLLSTGIQRSILNDSFTPMNVTVIILLIIVILALSGLFGSNFYRNWKRRANSTHKSNDISINSIYLARRGIKRSDIEIRTPRRKMPRQNRKRK